MSRSFPAATNCAMLVGHTTLRVATMDDLGKPATPLQITRMRELVREALEAGAIGVSTGLSYEPACAAPTEEVIEVCQPLKEHGRIYCTHMRNEGDRLLEAVEESLRIGQEAGLHLHISHHKSAGKPNWGKVKDSLERVDRAIAGGQLRPVGPALDHAALALAQFLQRTLDDLPGFLPAVLVHRRIDGR